MRTLLAVGVGDSRQAFGDLWTVYATVAAIVFGLVVLLLIVALRKKAATEDEDHSSVPKLEKVYVVGLVIIAGLLVWQSYTSFDRANAVPSAKASAATTEPHPASAPTVNVIASRWTWRFDYGHGVIQSSGSLTIPPVLVVPAGVPVHFKVTSSDVVHAFWIPEQRTKYDAVPGHTNAFWMTFDPSIDYKLARCSEFCGTYHDLMTFNIRVLPPAQFSAWLATRRREAGA